MSSEEWVVACMMMASFRVAEAKARRLNLRLRVDFTLISAKRSCVVQDDLQVAQISRDQTM